MGKESDQVARASRWATVAAAVAVAGIAYNFPIGSVWFWVLMPLTVGVYSIARAMIWADHSSFRQQAKKTGGQFFWD
jgi:hypothetical protein